MQRPDQPDHKKLVAVLFFDAVRPWQTTLTKPFTAGKRYVRDPGAARGFCILLGFALLGQSPILTCYVLPVTFGAQLLVAFTCDPKGHSFYIGDSYFRPKGANPVGARVLEAMIAFGIGCLLFDGDKAAGLWFWLSSASQAAMQAKGAWKEADRDLDLSDGMIETRARIGRLRRR